jgi:hypothetical protein
MHWTYQPGFTALQYIYECWASLMSGELHGSVVIILMR